MGKAGDLRRAPEISVLLCSALLLLIKCLFVCFFAFFVLLSRQAAAGIERYGLSES